jgi:hypothetical protein
MPKLEPAIHPTAASVASGLTLSRTRALLAPPAAVLCILDTVGSVSPIMPAENRMARCMSGVA